MVDLPAPGTPLMPTRMALPVRGSRLEQNLGARLILWLGTFDQSDGAAERDPVAGDDRLGGRIQIILQGVFAAHRMRR